MGIDRGAPPPDQLSTQGTVAAVSCNDVHSFTKPVRDEIVLVAGLGVAGDAHAGVTVKHRSRVAADPHQPNLRQVHLIHSELHAELVEAGYEVPAGGLGENITTAGIDLLALPVGTVLRFGPPPVISGAASGSATGTGADFAIGSEATGSVTGAAAVMAAASRAELDVSTANTVAALAARLAVDDLASGGGRGGSSTGLDHDPRPAVFVAGLRNPCQQINRYRSGLLKRVLGRAADGSLVRRAGVMGVVLRGGPVRAGAEIHVELPSPPHRPLDRV